MNIFVFQSTPDRYDLRQAIVPGKADTWYATRYRNEMHPGDLAFFWMAGDEFFRGLYGWGSITSNPYLKANWDSHGVDVTYKVKFEKPISAKSLRNDRELADMLIFRAPQATNFLLTPTQAKRLVTVIKDRGEAAPQLKEDSR
jgi:predicted RNA-binding protein with PUA-like domain